MTQRRPSRVIHAGRRATGRSGSKANRIADDVRVWPMECVASRLHLAFTNNRRPERCNVRSAVGLERQEDNVGRVEIGWREKQANRSAIPDCAHTHPHAWSSHASREDESSAIRRRKARAAGRRGDTSDAMTPPKSSSRRMPVAAEMPSARALPLT